MDMPPPAAAAGCGGGGAVAESASAAHDAAPDTALDVPLGHCAHAVAPPALAYDPAAQGAHAGAALAVAENEPGAHGWHNAPPLKYCPAAHVTLPIKQQLECTPEE
jgi:hypothetical protein